MSWSSRSITTKTEVNLENISDILSYHCPYCHGDFMMDASGEHAYGAAATRLVDTYTCIECSEVFEIHQEDQENVSFLFSCNGVYVRYINDQFLVATNDKLQYRKLGMSAPHVVIPPFPVDFSNKEKLHQKLKTYVLFS